MLFASPSMELSLVSGMPGAKMFPIHQGRPFPSQIQPTYFGAEQGVVGQR
jgi:hypothetical protein